MVCPANFFSRQVATVASRGAMTLPGLWRSSTRGVAELARALGREGTGARVREP